MRYSVLAVFFLWLFATLFWWAFAFVQLPAPSPDWLLRAQSVCFGKSELGLPDANGWRLLTLPSLLFFLSIIFVFFQELKHSLQELYKKTLGKLFLFSVGLIFITEFYFIAGIILDRLPANVNGSLAPVSLPENYLKSSTTLPHFELLDQNEYKFTDDDFKGQKTILTFAFANCDTICPTVVKNCIQALKEYGVERARLVVITLDPWRDTTARLKTALKVWKAPEGSVMLSGPIADVNSVLATLKVPQDRDLKTGFINHPAIVYVVDSSKKIVFSFNNPSARWIEDALERL